MDGTFHHTDFDTCDPVCARCSCLSWKLAAIVDVCSDNQILIDAKLLGWMQHDKLCAYFSTWYYWAKASRLVSHEKRAAISNNKRPQPAYDQHQTKRCWCKFNIHLHLNWIFKAGYFSNPIHRAEEPAHTTHKHTYWTWPTWAKG